MCSATDEVCAAVQTARESLVQHLRELRYRPSGQTIEQKAGLVGLTRQELYQWTGEGANPNPKLERIVAVATGLRVSVDELLGFRDDQGEECDDHLLRGAAQEIVESARKIEEVAAALERAGARRR